MRFLGKSSEIVGGAIGIERGFHVDDVPGMEILGGTIERQFLEPGQFGVHVYDAVTAVVAFADGNAFGVEIDERGVEGGETGCVCEGGAFEDAAQNCFEASGGGGAHAGIDVSILWCLGLSSGVISGEVWEREGGVRWVDHVIEV